MKKMFMDAEKMTTKAYVKPVMKVVEVDVECLQTPGSPGNNVESENPKGDGEDNELGVKSHRYWF